MCENKAADQLHSNCAADQRLCFCYIYSTLPLLPKTEISGPLPSSVAVQPSLVGNPEDGVSRDASQFKGYNVIGFCGHFLRFCQIKFICIAVALRDLVHDVETAFHL